MIKMEREGHRSGLAVGEYGHCDIFRVSQVSVPRPRGKE